MIKDIEKIFKNKSILITGSSGYLGSTLANRLSIIDCNLILVDKTSKPEFIISNSKATVTYKALDITRKRTWEEVLTNIDIVFHLAGLEYNRINFNYNLDYKINSFAVYLMLDVCLRFNFSPKIVFTSSANILESTSNSTANEHSESSPLSIWSAHKLLSENYLNIYKTKYNIQSTVLRLSNVYGPSSNKNKTNNVVVNKLIKEALNFGVLKVFNNKACIRDYIYIDDVINALLLSGYLSGLNLKYFIIGSGEGISINNAWNTIAKKIEEKFMKPIRIIHDSKIELEPFDYRNFIADYNLFQTRTNWQPVYTFEMGIDKTINSIEL